MVKTTHSLERGGFYTIKEKDIDELSDAKKLILYQQVKAEEEAIRRQYRKRFSI